MTAISQGLLLSISTLAAEFAMTRETVAKRIADARLAPAGEHKGNPVYRLKDAIPVLLQFAVAGGAPDPAKMDPFRRKAHFQAERAALELQTEQRELIPRIEVEQEQSRILSIVARTLDTLPDVVERDCGATPGQIERLEQALDSCREALYAELSAAAANDVRDSA